jgi:gliding motility-associated lipoprotein GldD
MRITIGIYFLILLIYGCSDSTPLPKPRAYPRIEYPERKYITFDSVSCPFTFEYPSYATIKNKERECWFDLFMPDFQARIHCSYLPVNNQEEFDDLVKDAYEIADRINARANYMEDSRMKNNHGVSGVIFEWSGPAASNLHFFLTDTTQHFFKGALYFDARVQPDSLAPISAFIIEDIRHLISSFAWKDK